MFRPRIRTKTLAIAASVAAAALILTGCANGTPSASTASGITTAWPSDITSLDPVNLSTPQDQEITRNIYQGLVQSKFTIKNGELLWDGTTLAPSLATSWDVGATSVTFHLRHGVTFYGTNDVVTAEDVKYSIGRVFSSPGAGDMKANGLQSADDITVVDATTVTINFKNTAGVPTATTPTLMAVFREPFTSIIDEQAVKKHITASDPTGAKWLRNNAVGTGPYYIASRTVGQQIVLKSVPNSWKAQPAEKTVTIRVVNSASTAALLQRKQINVAEFGLTNDNVNTLSTAGFSVHHASTPEFTYLAIGSDTGPLSNVKVRQAIAYAVPYNDIIKSVYSGRAERAYSMVSQSAPEYTQAWSQYSTNVAKAKALMADAGSPTINIPLLYSGADVSQEDIAILLQSAFKSIGITTTLVPKTQAELFDAINARSQPAAGATLGAADILLFNWSAWTDDPKIPIGYATTTGGINNYSQWSSPVVDKINTEYALQATSPARTAAYKQAQQIIADADPVLPILINGRTVVTAKGITDVSFSPGGGMRYWTLTSTK